MSLNKSMEELDQNQYHPMGGEETTDFLKRLVAHLSPYGRFLEEDSASAPKAVLTVKRDPVLYLRKRNLGFSTALEAILEDIPNREFLPESLASLVGIGTANKQETNGNSALQLNNVDGEDEKVLLSKEANAEQLEIAQRLEKYGSVLVQGPPGTGKTHTIANLLGHLLAQGKSVLVTSHTAKALKVLREKVIDPLQPLCVSVLESDSDSRQQLENSVDVITERLSSLDADVLDRQSDVLLKNRSELIQQLRETRERLKWARHDEYRKVVVAGQEYDPVEAARYVAAHRDTDAWIPSPVVPNDPLPLSHSELAELYHTNMELTAEEETELGYPLPDPQELLPPARFEQLVQERSRLANQDLDYRKDLWGDVSTTVTPEQLLKLMERLRLAVEPLLEETEWRMAAILAGFNGELHRQVWDELIQEIVSVYELAANVQSQLLRLAPELSETYWNEPMLATIEEIIQHLKNGGKLGTFKLLTKPSWKKIKESSKVNGNQPEKAEHYEALHKYVSLQIARSNLLQRWERQVTSMGGPQVVELGKEPEKVGRHFTDQLLQCLNWYQETWTPLKTEMLQFGVKWEELLNETPVKLAVHGELIRKREVVLERLPAVISSQCDRLSWNQIEAELAEVREKISDARPRAMDSDVVGSLHEAMHSLDTEKYRTVYGQLADLHSQNTLAKRRQELLRKLEKSAPIWAASIQNREGIHGQGNLPGDPASAWLWRQLHDELERREQTSMQKLQNRIALLGTQLRKVTGELVEKKAWAAQIRRTTLPQRQALMGWKTIIARLGKRTGKRVPYLLAEARKLMPVCQTAVPVWIMPLNRVVENFDPRQNQFDVVIIDEASQSDVMALTAFYLARQVVVVGDDQQVSPESVGKKSEDTQQLIDAFLKEIPNAALYDGKTSIYDLAKTAFAGMVQLREHFRCVPEIIQFSNHLSYDGKILPLRDPSKVNRKPFTVAYRVESPMSDDKVNEQEALHVASLLVAAAEQPEYSKATFGVISLVGEEQAIRIEMLLRQRLHPAEFQRRSIRCGNSAQFQGDERDVMFLSVVDAPSGEGPLRKRTDDMFKKRFNVAASRARDQMWVVHSLDPELDLKEEDLRKRLILHAQNPNALTETLARLEEHTESEFEKQVLQRLVRAGYKVTPQWQVGAYRIDMVVEGGGKRLAVECDGDKWHPIEKLEEDMSRQAILERLGWTFVRIRGSQFFRDPEKAMQPVFAKLNSLEIPPGGMEKEETSPDSDYELKERIIRRAAELRKQWVETDPDWGGSVTVKKTSKRKEEPTVQVESKEDPLGSVENEWDNLFEAVTPKLKELQEKLQQQESKALTGVQESIKLQVSPTRTNPKNSSRLVADLLEQGLEVIDKRGAKGALWVVGGKELEPFLKNLGNKGIKFTFAENGSRSTKNRPAWFTYYSRE